MRYYNFVGTRLYALNRCTVAGCVRAPGVEELHHQRQEVEAPAVVRVAAGPDVLFLEEPGEELVEDVVSPLVRLEGTEGPSVVVAKDVRTRVVRRRVGRLDVDDAELVDLRVGLEREQEIPRDVNRRLRRLDDMRPLRQLGLVVHVEIVELGQVKEQWVSLPFRDRSRAHVGPPPAHVGGTGAGGAGVRYSC